MAKFALSKRQAAVHSGDCPKCGALKGRECMEAGVKRYSPHKERFALAREIAAHPPRHSEYNDGAGGDRHTPFSPD